MAGQRPKEVHDLLQKRHFSIWPWAIRISIMCMSFAALTYVKYKLMEKNEAGKRPNFTIPATRSR